MKILELFCGMGGWSKGFHDILPNAEYYGIDIKDLGYPYNFIKADILDWTPDQKYDVVLASPPCTEFSECKRNTAAHPYDERIGLDLIWKTYDLVSIIKPTYWVIENVKGLQEFIPDVKEAEYVLCKICFGDLK
jgi:site-specific DNA-cytosine methylase